MKSYALLALALVASMGKLPGRKGSLRRREYVQPRQSRPHLDLNAVTLGWTRHYRRALKASAATDGQQVPSCFWSGRGQLIAIAKFFRYHSRIESSETQEIRTLFLFLDQPTVDS